MKALKTCIRSTKGDFGSTKGDIRGTKRSIVGYKGGNGPPNEVFDPPMGVLGHRKRIAGTKEIL